MHDLKPLQANYLDDRVSLCVGDSIEVLKSFELNSVDAVVTDPPYELGFMGKGWDSSGIAYSVDLWKEALRVLKPGGHLLAFGGTRTYHRMACAIEDAGFEIRDQLQWLYGSGFPKSLDVSKAIDRSLGAQRGKKEIKNGPQTLYTKSGQNDRPWKQRAMENDGIHVVDSDEPATVVAAAWNGWGTALKPANEPICLARKPLEKGLTVAQNVLKWGTGALNIDACLIETEGRPAREIDPKESANGVVYAGRQEPGTGFDGGSRAVGITTEGRWPANVIHDGSEEVLEQFPHTASGKPAGIKAGGQKNCYGEFAGGIPVTGFGDEGSAARFFYCAKASQSERNRNSDNHHPTVKPVDLMAYLCRLITPPKGIILDPFNGSGSTGIAAIQEGFKYIGIDLDPEYIEITKHRLGELQVKLF